MRKTVHSKLIACYILIGIIGFLFATAGGSHFVESYLEGEVGHRLYDGATRFASDEIAKTQITEADKEGLQKLVDILASGEEAGVLLFDENAHVLVHSSNIDSQMAVSDAKSTETDFADTDKAAINDNISPFELDSELWESAEYRISNFYGYVQAGSNKILKEMNRKYTKEDYLAKIEKVKKRIPNISLSTDIIVGFPTETKEDFEETLDVLRKVEYDNIFSFIYSRREGTPAAKLDFVLTDEEIHENFNKLLEVQNEISKRKNEAYVGRVEKVLVDGVSKNDETTLSGRCDSSKIVNFKGDKSLIGKYIDVRITEAHTWSLNGEIAE